MRISKTASGSHFASILCIIAILVSTYASSEVVNPAAIFREPTPPANAASAPLEDTYWKLTQLDGQAVNLANARMEPHIVLDSKSHRLSGAGGCNQVAGSLMS